MKSRYSKIAVFVLLLATIYWLLASPAQATSLRKAPNNLGLVGYWSFNDGMGTTATDFSGNGNHGTLTNFGFTGTTSNWVGGKLGTALNFDGVNDYVDAGTGSSMNITGNMTISLWAKYGTQTQGDVNYYKGLVGKEYTSSYSLCVESNSTKVHMYIGGANRVSATPTQTNVWTHIVFRYDGSTAKLYFNGVEAGSAAYSGGIPSDLAQSIKIGRHNGYNSYFAGQIDEVRIYNRALGQTEIRNLYAQGVAQIANFGEYSTNPAYPKGAVAAFNFSKGTGITTDATGRGNTLTNSNGVTFGLGKLGSAANFVAASSQYLVSSALTGSGAGDLQSDGDFDQEHLGWVWLDTKTSGYIWGWSRNVSATMVRFALYYDSALDRFVLYARAPGGGLTTVPADNFGTPSTGRWYFIDTYFDSTADLAGISVNNGAFNTGSVVNGIDTSGVSAQFVYTFGGAFIAGAIVPFSGRIDSWAKWGKYGAGQLLTDPQRRYLYKGGITTLQAVSSNLTAGTTLANGLVGHWTFDGSQMTGSGGTGTALDSTTNHNNGTLTGGPTRTLGRLGQALSFDGVNDYVNAGNPASLNFERTDSFSISAWVKASVASPTKIMRIVGKEDASSPYTGYSITLRSDLTGDPYQFGIWRDANGCSGVEGIAINTPRTANTQWQHIVATYNGNSLTSGQKFYIDGVLQSSTDFLTCTGVNGSVLTSTPFTIGTIDDSTTNTFDGSLDEVRVYNRALSASEVLQLYNLGR